MQTKHPIFAYTDELTPLSAEMMPVNQAQSSIKTMEKPEKPKRKRMVPVPLNDGMNTPVPDQTEKHIPSASEAALIKQAENPLGDPHKV